MFPSYVSKFTSARNNYDEFLNWEQIMTSQIWRHQYKQNFIKWTRPKVWKVKQMMFFEVFDDSKWQNQKKKSKLTKYRNIYFEESSMSNLIEDHLRSVTGIHGSQRILIMVLRTVNPDRSGYMSLHEFVVPDFSLYYSFTFELNQESGFWTGS